jgi:hypothetical protein
VAGSSAGARFEEVDAADAARQIATRAVWLIQVRQARHRRSARVGCDVVTPDQPLPDLARAADRPIFVIAHDDPSARRFASRLVRGGFARVFVVRGGVPSLARARAGLAQPVGSA